VLCAVQLSVATKFIFLSPAIMTGRNFSNEYKFLLSLIYLLEAPLQF
jgi:hypothetical protein